MIAVTISSVLVFLLTAGGSYLYWLHKRPEKYTRNRFAFAGLAVLTTLSLAVIHTFSGPTPWEFVFAGLKGAATGTFDVPKSSNEGSTIAVLCLIIVTYAIIRLHRSWPGQITEEQWKAAQLNRQPNLISDAIAELKSLIAGLPQAPLHAPFSARDFAKIDPSGGTPQFNVFARELFCENYPDINFEKDPNVSWHDRGSFWVGNDRRTNRTVILFSTGSTFLEADLQSSVDYMQKLETLNLEKVDLFQVRRREKDYIAKKIGVHHIQSFTSDELLDSLTASQNPKIENYRESINQRVVVDTLPNSDLTIENTYTDSFVVVEQLGQTPVDFSNFLGGWAKDSRPSHIALLGEYGQGKSTSVLMFVHSVLQGKTVCSRLPILIELRGKSPKNQNPLELLGSWGANYGISGSALTPS